MSAKTFRRWTIASLGMAATLAAAIPVEARSAAHGFSARLHLQGGRVHARIILSGMVYREHSGGLQCVPFARENSGIELSGNAANWWNAADGIYERGARPEVGSVLNFRASGRMRMGHVAVVSNVLDPRNVEIDHANWSGRGSVRRNVRVVDVSAFNDWSAVRVALGDGDFGSVYPTYGFIYDRPDHGTMVANAGLSRVAEPDRTNTLPMMAAARDFRAVGQRIQLAPTEEQEVAEAPEDGAPRHHRMTHIARVRDGGGTTRFASTHEMGRGTSRFARTHESTGERTHVATVAHRTHGTQVASVAGVASVAPGKHHRRL